MLSKKSIAILIIILLVAGSIIWYLIISIDFNQDKYQQIPFDKVKIKNIYPNFKSFNNTTKPKTVREDIHIFDLYIIQSYYELYIITNDSLIIDFNNETLIIVATFDYEYGLLNITTVDRSKNGTIIIHINYHEWYVWCPVGVSQVQHYDAILVPKINRDLVILEVTIIEEEW